MKNTVLIPLVSFISVIVLTYGWIQVQHERKTNPFSDKHLLERGLDRPYLWLYYDTSEVNSRLWADFGARSSRVLNLPFLNLCYDSIAQMNGQEYRIEVIGGLTDLALRLGGWEKLPLPLRNPLAEVREGELNWIRAAILAKYGGLWLQPAAISLQPFGKLPLEKVVFFGTDRTENVAGTHGTRVPSMNAIWSPIPAHPIFVKWEQRAYTRLDSTNGGAQIRGDDKTDFVELARPAGIEVRPYAELSRKETSLKPLQLEDLLGAGGEGSLHFRIPNETVYVPIPWPEVKERRQFGWFLRMSEEQILKADLAVSVLFRKVAH